MPPPFVTGPFATSFYAPAPFTIAPFANSAFVTGHLVAGAYALDCPPMRAVLARPELLRAILAHLPQEARVAALCTCRRWFDAGTDAHWRHAHVHYLHYVPRHRQQYYANKIASVALRHGEARSAYAAARWLRFPRVRAAVFEADYAGGVQDHTYILPYVGTALADLAAHGLDLDRAFFDLLHRCAELRDMCLSAAPARRFFGDDVGSRDRIRAEPNLSDLIAHEADEERIAGAKSMLKLVADRPAFRSLHLGAGTEHLVTRQLWLTCARLRRLQKLYIARPLSDLLAAEITSIQPPPFQNLLVLILDTQSYTVPRIVPLIPKMVSMRLSIRDGESGRFLPSVGTLTELEILMIDVPSATQIKGCDLACLSSLVNLRHVEISYNKLHISPPEDATQVDFGDLEFRAMVWRWSLLEELYTSFGDGLTEEALFALGHSCPHLKTITLPSLEEFSPAVFAPLGLPLFPHLKSFSVRRINPAPPEPNDFDEWWDKPEPDRTINKFMHTLRKHFPKLNSFDCHDTSGLNQFFYRSMTALARGDLKPDDRKPRRNRAFGNFPQPIPYTLYAGNMV